MAAGLHDPAEHRPVADTRWSESAARDAIAEICADAVVAYRGPGSLWPNHPADLDRDSEDRPYRTAYLGAAGVAWALARLAGAGLAPELPGAGELTSVLHADYRAAPELTELETGTPPPQPSLMFGESGVLLVLEALDPACDLAVRTARRDALHACIAANTRNPSCELCWGSPGTLLAAAAMWRATGEPRWRELWHDGAAWLLDRWRELVWPIDVYGEVRRYVGAGHGFAGTAGVLLDGGELMSDLLGDEAAETVARIARTVAALAVDAGDCAQWPAFADAPAPRPPVQWCHGAPGIVISLAGLPADPETDRLLCAGGELTWRAGPLRKGSGLCHGTAGNAFALLALFRRTGDERWLDRARAFALDAAADVVAWRLRHGRGRYSLFTGDVGVALALHACLAPSSARSFPFLDGALDVS